MEKHFLWLIFEHFLIYVSFLIWSAKLNFWKLIQFKNTKIFSNCVIGNLHFFFRKKYPVLVSEFGISGVTSAHFYFVAKLRRTATGFFSSWLLISSAIYPGFREAMDKTQISFRWKDGFSALSIENWCFF